MLSVSYDPVLVVASVLVAIMAAFTGLRLASGLSRLAPADRKPRIAQAAVALGGGIWSMHFIAMLAVSLPVAITYSALPTLASVLIAILVTGVGLIVLHFGVRTQSRIIAAGTLTGLGIVAMHYLGMSAITGNCIVAYRPAGIILSIAIAIGASILALELAYRRRSLLTTGLGAVALGLAISAMHYAAMVFTTFKSVDSIAFVPAPNISQGTLAMIVTVAAFVICGLFLLMAIPMERAGDDASAAEAPPPAEPGDPEQAPATPTRDDAAPQPSGREVQALLSKAYVAGGPAERKPDPLLASRIPYERENTVRFFVMDQISAVRADGHYTRVLNGGGEFFCPWSISRVERAIQSPPFIRTHRSYLVNLRHVAGFRREGDKAYCVLDKDEAHPIPVSRSRITVVQKALGLI